MRDQDAAVEGLPHAYTPFAQEPGTRPMLAITTKGDPAPVLAEVRRTIGELEPGAPLANVRVLSDAVAQALANRRMTEILLTGFALLALLLAVVGIYGVMILYVTSRTREFGIRIAVGAEPSRVVRLVLREGLVSRRCGRDDRRRRRSVRHALARVVALPGKPDRSGGLHRLGAWPTGRRGNVVLPASTPRRGRRSVDGIARRVSPCPVSRVPCPVSLPVSHSYGSTGITRTS